MRKDELLNIMLDLPTDIRTQIVDTILQSLEKSDIAINQTWIREAGRRNQRFEQGLSKVIPGEEVFQKADEIINQWVHTMLDEVVTTWSDSQPLEVG